MDEETRKTLCRLIAGIVIADDHLDAREEAFLGRLVDRFGLPADWRACLFPAVDGREAADVLRGMTWAVQEEALQLLIEAAAVDDSYGEAERRYLYAVAEAMGVSTEEVDYRVARIIGG